MMIWVGSKPEPSKEYIFIKQKKNNIVFSIIFIKEKQCFNNIWKSNNTVNMYNNLWVTMLVAIVIIINIPLKGFGRRV